MGKLFVRVDDRLIHGQIVTAWCQTLGIDQIIAVDDTLASNPMLQSIMTMGVPERYNTQIVTIEQARQLLADGSDKNRLVIVRYSHTLGELRAELKGADHINIGNSSKLDDSIYKLARGTGWYIYLSQRDYDTLQQEVDDGVAIISQQLPTEKKIDWNDMKKSIEKQ